MSLLVPFVLAFLLVSGWLYVRFNDRRLSSIPARALAVSRERVTPELAERVAKELVEAPMSALSHMPPKTGRRYIVVGGAGFLGGWIVVHLLHRGEDPRRIRVLDIRAPTRKDLTSGKAREVEFIQVDVSDAGAVKAAFSAPWPPPSSLLGDSSSATDIASFVPPITVFHIVANIRFYERHLCFLDRSAKVNVGGTKSVLDSAASAGVDVLIYTSSGSVGIRRSRAWLWPWETEPPHFVQALTDDDALSPKCHEEFFSNYAATKMQAEKLVRQADGTPSGKGVLKTGCIRPGNGVFGPGGDILCGAYLVRRTNPTWIANTMHPFVYVENCVEAHLLYEQRLVEVLNRDPNGNDNDHHLPDIGGDCFSISDPNPPHTYKDIYLTLETLTRGECTFPAFSPTLMLLLAHVLEFYYVAWHTLHTTLCVPHALLPPPLTGDIINLQTSLFALTSVHLICDDSRARLPPERGGLGYRGTWTTLQGLCKTVEEHRMAGGIGEERSAKCGGVSFQFFSNVSGLGGLVTRAKRAVADVGRMLSRPSIEVTSQTPDDISPNS